MRRGGGRVEGAARHVVLFLRFHWIHPGSTAIYETRMRFSRRQSGISSRTQELKAMRRGRTRFVVVVVDSISDETKEIEGE